MLTSSKIVLQKLIIDSFLKLAASTWLFCYFTRITSECYVIMLIFFSSYLDLTVLFLPSQAKSNWLTQSFISMTNHLSWCVSMQICYNNWTFYTNTPPNTKQTPSTLFSFPYITLSSSYPHIENSHFKDPSSFLTTLVNKRWWAWSIHSSLLP